MQSIYIFNQPRTCYRSTQIQTKKQDTRNSSTMAFFPRAFASEFAPIFRLMDDYASHAVSRGAGFGAHHQVRQFQPRFDVKENKDSYELQGELPGVQRENLSIEFTDHHTLSIKGRTETHREEGARPGQQIEAASPSSTTAAAIETPATSDAMSETGSNYHKASVEDEDAPRTAAASEVAATPAQTVASPAQPAVQSQQSTPSARYWISERSTGSFARSFQFPSRVDQDNVRASLANGILSIIIPKSTIPQSRRINVE